MFVVNNRPEKKIKDHRPSKTKFFRETIDQKYNASQVFIVVFDLTEVKLYFSGNQILRNSKEFLRLCLLFSKKLVLSFKLGQFSTIQKLCKTKTYLWANKYAMNFMKTILNFEQIFTIKTFIRLKWILKSSAEIQEYSEDDNKFYQSFNQPINQSMHC